MSDISSPRDRGVGVTLKGAAGYDAPWITFSGTVEEVHEDIRNAFGFDEVSNAADLDLHDLVIEASKAFHAQHGVGEKLGGRPVGGGRARGTRAAKSETVAEGDAFDQAASSEPAAEEEEQGPDLPALIEACATVAEVKRLYVEHKDAFDSDKDLLALWKARGKALTTEKND